MYANAIDFDAAVQWLASEHNYLASYESIRMVLSNPDEVQVALRSGLTFRGTGASAVRFLEHQAACASLPAPLSHRALLVKLLAHMGTPLFDEQSDREGRRFAGLSEQEVAELNRLSNEARAELQRLAGEAGR